MLLKELQGSTPEVFKALISRALNGEAAVLQAFSDCVMIGGITKERALELDQELKACVIPKKKKEKQQHLEFLQGLANVVFCVEDLRYCRDAISLLYKAWDMHVSGVYLARLHFIYLTMHYQIASLTEIPDLLDYVERLAADGSNLTLVIVKAEILENRNPLAMLLKAGNSSLKLTPQERALCVLKAYQIYNIAQQKEMITHCLSVIHSMLDTFGKTVPLRYVARRLLGQSVAKWEDFETCTQAKAMVNADPTLSLAEKIEILTGDQSARPSMVKTLAHTPRSPQLPDRHAAVNKSFLSLPTTPTGSSESLFSSDSDCSSPRTPRRRVGALAQLFRRNKIGGTGEERSDHGPAVAAWS